MTTRDYTSFDQLLIHFDKAVRTVFGAPVTTDRPNPADGQPEATLNDYERRVATGLMRVNHAGVISAQALYLGGPHGETAQCAGKDGSRGARGNRSSRVVRAASHGTRQPHEPAQSALVRGLFCDRRGRGTCR